MGQKRGLVCVGSNHSEKKKNSCLLFSAAAAAAAAAYISQTEELSRVGGTKLDCFTSPRSCWLL